MASGAGPPDASGMATDAAPPPDLSLRPRFGLAEAALTGVVLIWAANFSLVKFGVDMGAPSAFYLVRMAGALAVLLPLRALTRRRSTRGTGERRPAFDRRDLPGLLFAAFTGHALFQIGYIHGTDLSSATSAALILGLTPVAIAVIAWVTRTEAFSRPAAFGLALSVAGVALVSGTEVGAAAHLGNAGLAMAMLAWAVYTVRSAPLVRKYGPLRVTTWCCALGMGMLLIPAPFSVSAADFLMMPSAWWATALVSGGGAITAAHLLWGFATVRLGPTLTGIFSNLTPLPALALSALWLGEPLGAARVAGAVLIVAGVAVARTRRRWSGGGFPRRMTDRATA